MKQVIARLNGEGFESVIYREFGGERINETVSYQSDLDVDADGANGQFGKLAAYRLDGNGSELLGNGGIGVRGGKAIGVAKWYADIVLVDADGFPMVLPSGIIPSMTAYRFPGVSRNSPAAYLDSESVPYIAVPPIVRTATQGTVLGCQCAVTYGSKRVIAMVGDIGPRSKNGEGSIELCRRLDIDPSPRSGGIDTPDILFEIWPGVPAVIDDITYALLRA